MAKGNRAIGVDLSHWDYDEGVRANHFSILKNRHNVSFVIAKISEGQWNYKESFTEFFKASKANDIIPGAYHFLRQDNGKEQALNFINSLKDFTNNQLDNMIFAVDVEPVRNGPDPRWVDVKDFVETWYKKFPNKQLFIYTAGYVWNSGNFKNPKNTLNCLLWNANWNYTVDNVQFGVGYGAWKKATIVQVAGKGKVRLPFRGLDTNVFDGSAAELLALISGTDLPVTDKPCPPGFHKSIEGNCIPNSNIPVDNTYEEPWTNASEISTITAATNVNYNAAILIIGLLIGGLVLGYIALKASSNVTKVVDVGEQIA